jgi:hypothetical protein
MICNNNIHDARNQSSRQINVSIVSVFSMFQKSLITVSPVLNANLDTTIDAGIVRTSCAIKEITPQT